MSWIGVVTDAGAALLAQWASGSHVLHISGATVGSGTRPEANLRAATDLIAEEDDAQIVSVKTVDSNQQQIRVRVNAIDGTSYTAKEIGIWAHLDSDQTETLLQIHQDTTGVLIPTATDIPGFYFDLYSRMIVDGDGEIDVTIAQEAYATQDDIQKYEDGNHFAICTSGMTASAKTITVDSMPFDLDSSNDPPSGSTIKVLFQKGNSSSNPTIQITDGVKTTRARNLVLYNDGNSVTAADNLKSGGLYEIVFISPYWVIATAGFDQFVRDKLNNYFQRIFFLQKGLAVLADDEDTHAALEQGQYVLLEEPGTLPSGLYKATTAIPSNGKLTSSNVTAVSSGGLNDLKDQIDTLNSKKTTIISGVTTDTYILGLDAGVYQISGGNNTRAYVPTDYGTLVIDRSGTTYGKATIVDTNGNMWIRHMNGTTAWHNNMPWVLLAAAPWKQLTGVQENVAYSVPAIYNEVMAECTFTSGQRLMFNLPKPIDKTLRSDIGYYYTASSNGSGAMIWSTSGYITIYHPYQNGAEKTYSEITVFAR